MFHKLDEIDFRLKRLEERQSEYTRELIDIEERISRLRQERSVVERELVMVEYKRLPKGEL